MVSFRNSLVAVLLLAMPAVAQEQRVSEECPGGGYAQQGHCPGLLSSPAYSGVTTSSVTCGVTYANTGPRGTVQVCVSESSEPPSAEQGTGFAACSGEMDSAAVEALGSLGVEISGLQPNTTYYCHVVAINPLAPTGNGRITNVVTSASFETLSTGDHAYFEMLRGNEHFLDSIAYRSQEEITPEIAAASNGGVYYDETVDAARFPNSSGSTSQLRHPYPGRPYNHAKGGTLLTYWEARWGAGYRYLDGARNGVNTHKAFQFSNEDNGTGSLGLFMEPRALYGRIESYVSNGGDPNAIAYVDIRAYGGLVTQTGGQQTPEGGNYSSDSVSPIANHYRLKAEVWHSFWLFVDWDNNELSMWVAEAGEAPVLVYDRNTATFNTNLQRFVFEFNTSQDRSPQTPPINTWGRNVVSLRNPTFAEVAALVGQF